MTAEVLTAWEKGRLDSVAKTFGHHLPLYDSAQWWALEADDPRRWAAVVRAAAAWRFEGRLDQIEQRLQEELARVDRMVLERLRSASHDIAGALDWNALAAEPTHAELTQRRAP